ncbi:MULTISPECIES: bifunctional adenosylcobinamide kinase/adenosylcobinamide-phosphate guanylyltransferase [unclassified Nostoc]|uniref:bifunctional adenosylcobinamide kinase/adenosylcobinamide-phosphate guanylyltransferase n=1 Tax=unclassified Nostoc TaxID=2593658 RepID=UPI0025AA834D|nr:MULTISPECIES: bifunctional adenosylcobinamide kinase/adenosylcobinamide-phosphate guanylyltransferase [unclassified Nostoc]MDM9581082.1 bifunctional adenosylcobinamide kinase/adenosylcobinamide-phosphate guanylyltransferase [Nostoc sp. GT001]MDZ7948677.1 bifunctional adenosylcobinamide kinase/adenosylcobinamide-phosphate guanylyltransferase [Nostoc sp. EfeVER01]MDZ7991154.1 bifunctional adenosylcobinamide kinase/adenosylcobinamide-phosphate guanylyltransferase [Nostoc sp. EspVER01]
MGKIILVTGPARSGKSEWAEALAIQSGKAVVYIATATDNPDDEEWHQRILEHQQRRPQDWVTLSVPVELSATLADAKPYTCLLVDSLGTWVANLLEQDESSWENTLAEFLETVELVAADMLFVAEEVGWGVIPAYPLGRAFRDRLGSLVRQLSTLSETVYLVTGGHVLNLSILGSPLPKRGDPGTFRSQDS